MNKKLMVFAMVGIIAMALVSGGLVSYLSNQAEVSVTVESPVLLEVSLMKVLGQVIQQLYLLVVFMVENQ